jgi:hypothetical protein
MDRRDTLSLVALAVIAIAFYLLPDHYRAQGRDEQIKLYQAQSEQLAQAQKAEFTQIQAALKTERDHHAQTKADFEKSFIQYRDAIRAGNTNGLRINTAGLCPSQKTETASAGRTEPEASARLPRAIEEGLLNFAHDRDKIILDFEDFKQQVRVAGCFAE